ncbi:hypothetical protein AYK24_08390 [Thermoplasmatales archaeon SG8-52-4]|nr:MAG: hypothetical protein AYK24_08390 [Thermoplasmatales archaeon SG8-52-4]
MGIEKKKVSFGIANRLMTIKRATEIVKEKSPIHVEKMLSWIELECGIKRDNAKSILIILKDTDKITLDSESGMIYWGKKSQIPQENEEETG